MGGGGGCSDGYRDRSTVSISSVTCKKTTIPRHLPFPHYVLCKSDLWINNRLMNNESLKCDADNRIGLTELILSYFHNFYPVIPFSYYGHSCPRVYILQGVRSTFNWCIFGYGVETSNQYNVISRILHFFSFSLIQIIKTLVFPREICTSVRPPAIS